MLGGATVNVFTEFSFDFRIFFSIKPKSVIEIRFNL